MVLNATSKHRMKSARLHLSPEFPDLIARAGLSQRAFARRAGVSFSTIMGLVHPEIHPGRRGGMQRRTAWLLAKAYAGLVGIEAEEAFKTFIIVEHDLTPSPGT
jgi:transcriptional regulator with XRE-family HTH domain